MTLPVSSSTTSGHGGEGVGTEGGGGGGGGGSKPRKVYKFLGFFPTAEEAARVHDSVAYHVLGHR